MFKKIVNPFFLLTLILLICTISKVDAQGGPNRLYTRH